MKRPFPFLPALFFCLLAVLRTAAQSQAPSSPPKLVISHLVGDLYVYTTWQPQGGSPYPANSMYLVTDKGVALIDGPWDSTQCQPLLDSIYRRHHQKVVLCIATHFHEDRTRALDFLRERGVATYSSAETYALCVKNHKPLAEHVFTRDTVFRLGNVRFSTFYPGEGHTRDNIVVWFPANQVLYGGCFIKSTEVGGLGNVADANVAAWPRSVRRVMDKYPHPAFVIPGHQGWSDLRSLQHTLDLLRAAPVP
ncbi:MAG: BlaB/IND/MUS family subclass B1 metallo-beta-lactamase [Bacteroidota bacterium]|nr:BlaB/IND/MUS family subclass B1 metallo-beta-lactamase [Bacteroidota bacterium]MDP4215291.1 BlaB/IND/MUS family subclass B1 metallo-beta-lactamase [Bacteroidota bacterium]MDP4245890.1 BlaB/IND/MUS family subclass B1 metallo-beta-lactamase [Bacteroidota bacterium]MDP4254283.1 BlaB/IND/MUS family subclass B1 metallo-beta-lactamase [Bacteroidota bacterium]MDP4259157.1 BlaB/IND/MUS family subclass B1 metallo-beta-lactamase [Bacteroidota bacterium]